jgi:hypothetical protein
MIELRRFEKTLKLRIERKNLSQAQISEPREISASVFARQNTNTLKSRTLSCLPGEVFA